MKNNYFEMTANENRILQFLVSDRWYSYALITELTKKFDKSWNTISEAAKLLKEKKLITKEDGSLRLVKDNKTNYYFKLFIDRFRINELNEDLKDIVSYTLSRAQEVALTSESKLLSLLVFGSIASGEFDKESDIDLLVVLKNIEDKIKLEKLKGEIISKKHINFGNINVIVMSNKEIEQRYLDADDLLVNILSRNLIVYDEDFLWNFMERELFIPSHKIIFTRMEQLEKNKEKLLELSRLDNAEELRKEFYNHLIKEARVELLRKKIPIPAITKKDVIRKIKTFNKELFDEIENIDKGDIKQKVLHYVSR